MALAKEIMGKSLLERTLLTSGTLVSREGRARGGLTQVPPEPRMPFNHHMQKQYLCVNPKKTRKVVKMRTRSLVIVAGANADLVRVMADENEVKFKVRAIVTIRNKIKENLKEKIVKRFDALNDIFGKNVCLQLVSTEIDPKTSKPKTSSEAILKDWLKKINLDDERVNYTAEFDVHSNFGIPGAILVSNKHMKEFFLEAIVLQGFASGPVHFPCSSWVQSMRDHPAKRIFFSNQPYLPHETPVGLKELREEELKDLRGDGTGERKLCDRIYDYDIYNDLGNPDKGIDWVRPNLGGGEIQYPRRSRTGRPPMKTDPTAESRIEKPTPMYVPRDEQFEEIKMDTFKLGRLKGLLHNLLPNLMTNISAENQDFKDFSDIDSLYKDSLLAKLGMKDAALKMLPIIHKVEDSSQSVLKFDVPHIISQDRFAWSRDDEFGRQAIAGVNPVSIERLKVFPPVSSLDPKSYDCSLESALKEEHILPYLNGMSVSQAMENNKLYIVDYHDAYLPFIDRINALDGHKSYATRTLYFLSPQGTLKPIAIELSLPSPSSRPKRVVTPPLDATSNWIWLMAKAHVCSNDAGAHQLLHHWLRTHASMEPFIIAAHRQLSAMHPIYKLLDPHMRYTLEINSLARQSLISNDGVIETCFTVGPYGMEISAEAYKKNWRFDMEGLPADLIRRGMAVPDTTQPHSLQLVIEDYPFATDGLLVWSAIEKWVRTYVKRYYPNSKLVTDDTELQAWYSESINLGHADKKDEPWWPKLDTPENLASILTTLIWLASALHASLNFGQYPYGGYIPNRPPLMRRLIPDESDPEYTNFLTNPQKYFLSSLPSLLGASKYMAVVESLSTHSADEEYIGERQHPTTWTGDSAMVDAFFGFSMEIRKVDKEIERRNLDPSLRNRCGAGVLPYELLAPSSEHGVTNRGIPNSSSI